MASCPRSSDDCGGILQVVVIPQQSYSPFPYIASYSTYTGVRRSELLQRRQLHRFLKSLLFFSPFPTPRLLLLPLLTKKATNLPNSHDCNPPVTPLCPPLPHFTPSRPCRYRDLRPAPAAPSLAAASDVGCAFDNASELLPPLLCVLYRLGTEAPAAASLSHHAAQIAGSLSRVLVGIDVDTAEASLALLMVLQQCCSSSETFCSALLATQTSDVVTSRPPFSSSSIISSISGASSNTSAHISTGSTVIHCILTACISTNDLHAAAAMLCIASLSLNHSPATFTLAAAPQTLSTMQMVCGRMSHYASSPSPAAAATVLAAASLMLSALLPSPALSPLLFKLASFASPFTHIPPLCIAIHVLAHIVSQQSADSSSSIETTTVSNTRIFATTSLAYFAHYLSSTWDSVASSAPSSAAPSASTPRMQLSQTVSHILASSPCQVRLSSAIYLQNLASHCSAQSCRDPFCCWCWKKRSRGAVYRCVKQQRTAGIMRCCRLHFCWLSFALFLGQIQYGIQSC
jgi:hypothetical protein